MRFALPLLFLLFATSPALSGQLNRFDLDEQTRWRPSDCMRPTPPFIGAVTTAESRNRAVGAFNAYVKSLSEYLACAVEEANEDIAAFREIVSGSLEAEKQELRSEAEELKSLIESGGRQ